VRQPIQERLVTRRRQYRQRSRFLIEESGKFLNLQTCANIIKSITFLRV
jgi:hypothetical protein